MPKHHVVRINKDSQTYEIAQVLIESLQEDGEGTLTLPELVRQAIRIVYDMGHFGAKGKGGRFSWHVDKTGAIKMGVIPVIYNKGE